MAEAMILLFMFGGAIAGVLDEYSQPWPGSLFGCMFSACVGAIAGIELSLIVLFVVSLVMHITA